MELINLFGKFDSTFASKSSNMFNSFTSKSNRLQNEMIETMSIVLHRKILTEVESAGFYCILAVDARSHKEEYLSICLRYVLNLKIYVRFIYFEKCSDSQTAKSLYATISNKLNSLGIYIYI